MLTFSLIIPVYNEERHIGECLDAISSQTVMPTEVIIIDNNCTDRTIEIAKSYKFVKIIHEARQGRGHARSAGFNAAKGDVIGRIDADSRINRNWVELVMRRFEQDPELAGLTGMSYTPCIPYVSRIKAKIFSRAYYWFAHAAFDTVTMWGANMALRRSAWEMVKDKVCLDDSIVHEDQDVSLWIAASGGKIMQDNQMIMTTDEQMYRYFPKLLHYTRLYESTKHMHYRNGNLSDPELRRIGFFRTLPGRIFAVFPGLYLIAISVLLFPVDYFLLHSRWKPNSIS